MDFVFRVNNGRGCIIMLNLQVMLFGHNDDFTADKIMKVTVVFNHFGHDLVQRMPR